MLSLKKYLYFFSLLLLLAVFLFLIFDNVYAVSLTRVSDTISTSRKNALANHTIVFTLTTSIPASGKIVITPEANDFEIISTLNHTDMDVAVNGIDLSLAVNPGSGAGSALGVSVITGKNGSIIITLNDTDALMAGSTVAIEIGSQAAHQHLGHKSIVNPLLIGSYKIHIETRDASSVVLDRADAMIAIVEQVTMGLGIIITVCGNGILEQGEECDDGNNISGDGCSANCRIEPVPVPAPVPAPIPGVVPPLLPTRAIFQGKAHPLSLVTVLQDGKVVATTVADSLANFKVEISPITPGIWTFGIWAEDREERRSLTFSFTTRVRAEMITTINGIFLSPTIELSRTLLQRGETLNILGQTAPGSDISIFINSPGQIVKKTQAEADGTWFYPFDTTPLPEGIHGARAKAICPDGLLSALSQVLAFSVGRDLVTVLCPKGDLNKDGKVNLVDFSILLYWWGRHNVCADQNQDGTVNLPDFSIMMYWWTG